VSWERMGAPKSRTKRRGTGEGVKDGKTEIHKGSSRSLTMEDPQQGELHSRGDACRRTRSRRMAEDRDVKREL